MLKSLQPKDIMAINKCPFACIARMFLKAGMKTNPRFVVSIKKTYIITC